MMYIGLLLIKNTKGRHVVRLETCVATLAQVYVNPAYWASEDVFNLCLRDEKIM